MIRQLSPTTSIAPPRPESSGLLGLKTAVLLVILQSTITVSLPLMKDEPPRSAVLFIEVILSNKALCPITHIAPPSVPALLLETLVSVNILLLQKIAIPPPSDVALLFKMVQFST